MVALQPWLILAFVATVTVSGVTGFAAGYRAAGDAKDAQYNAERVEASKNALKAVENAVRANEEYRARQQTTNRKVIDEYEQKLADLERGVPAGGLRVRVGPCGSRADAPAPVADSTGPFDGACTGAVELPARTADDLFALAERADRLAEQLRALQQWVKESGLDGGP